MSPIREKTYPNGMRGVIEYDPNPQPYDGDTVSQIAYMKSSRYTLGTEAVNHERMDEIRDGIEDGTYIGLPVFAYVHGGATIRAGSGFSCPWDSGQSGFVYCDREQALSEFKTEEAVIECLKAEVKLFDAYLTGEVYGYRLLDKDGEELESCWGFYGDDAFDYMFSELDAHAEYYMKKEQAERDEARYWAEHDVMTTP
jgi:hypothetical protein